VPLRRAAAVAAFWSNCAGLSDSKCDGSSFCDSRIDNVVIVNELRRSVSNGGMTAARVVPSNLGISGAGRTVPTIGETKALRLCDRSGGCQRDEDGEEEGRKLHVGWYEASVKVFCIVMLFVCGVEYGCLALVFMLFWFSLQ